MDELLIPPIPQPQVVVDLETGMRALRDKLLLENVDRVNPIWYASLSDAQKQQLATYRQALLDVTKQPGWPADVIWPTIPSFV